eukprot:3708124-Pyramimonas_sp.AAC.1
MGLATTSTTTTRAKPLAHARVSEDLPMPERSCIIGLCGVLDLPAALCISRRPLRARPSPCRSRRPFPPPLFPPLPR